MLLERSVHTQLFLLRRTSLLSSKLTVRQIETLLLPFDTFLNSELDS